MSMDQPGWIDLGGVLKCKNVLFGVVCADFVAQSGQMRPCGAVVSEERTRQAGAWRPAAHQVLQSAIAPPTLFQGRRQRTAPALVTPGSVLQAALSVGGAWVG